jgi:hypothetical protein
VEQLTDLMSNLRLEMLATEMWKGLPGDETYAALDDLADAIQERHAAI